MVPCAGRFFDWEVFHFSQIVGSFDLLRIWLLGLDVIAARVIPMTRPPGGMVLRLRHSNRAIKWRGKQAYVRTVWRLPRVQACTMLGLGFTSYAPHGHFWSSALYGNTLWYHKSQLLPKSTFQGMSNSLWLWVGPRSWLANFLMVQGSQILCNIGRYESLTTSIAEVFITRMSKRCLISWRWHKDWAVFQNIVVTSLFWMRWLSTSIWR